ncbi:mannose-1-phosphate guanylyltransferase [Litorimonas cladophorae]|uniref:Mannose-1-phosphate guanylyltransferase n=1 Tax=Litorimonas cladophorae TaxID=1220491 RepID=A0A918KQY7_9PROT|nr:nucleotidyltransferase family protein [Litorimonas cladophorae]GGX72498.1 mannose-1-phosphate guanylyltransferase [Litorimonas cladophorae]
MSQAQEITTAMVLAAGHGTRMRPLTDHCSKAMVEVGGKPLIDHMLDRLGEAGIQRAVVNVHAHADHLEAHLKMRQTGPDIIISDEREQLLETGGGMVKALPLLGEAPVLACNIDAIWTESGAPIIASLLQRWDPALMDDLLLLAPIEKTLGYHGKGDFLFAHDGRLERRGDHAQAPYVYAGVQITKLDRLAKQPVEPFSRNRIWDETLKAGTIFGHPLDGFWMHVGDPQARDEAELRLKT